MKRQRQPTFSDKRTVRLKSGIKKADSRNGRIRNKNTAQRQAPDDLGGGSANYDAGYDAGFAVGFEDGHQQAYEQPL